MQKYVISMLVAVGVALALSGAASADSGKQAKPSPAPKVHEVQSGESLSIIADAEQLPTWRPLWDANAELTNPDVIYEGQKLIVPQENVPERALPEEAMAVPAVQSRVVAPVYRSAVWTNASATSMDLTGVDGILARVRQRESGGNYATNTGNGYYGAYQFDLGTWRGVGGVGLPSQASPAEQDMRARMLYEQRGCSPWPNTCR